MLLPCKIVCSINRAGLSIGADQSASAQVENIYSKEVNNAYFSPGAKIFFEQQNAELCAFMLHQLFD
ncbi:hypothetical protein ASE74_05405 [Pedobacter sp. Leaf216]|nr:hypothetical protein ASE74_05405 [Pedobacter sp. Leaf216]